MSHRPLPTPEQAANEYPARPLAGAPFSDPDWIICISQSKGRLFVAASSLLLNVLLLRLLVRIETSRERELEAELERRIAVDKVLPSPTTTP